MEPALPILEIHGIDVVYGDAIHVLRGVSLEVPTGSVVALLGANGAGKTTLLRACSGLLRSHGGAITAGSVRLDGVAVERSDPSRIVRLGLAQVMEGRRIFGELSVEENLRAGAFSRHDRAGVRESHDRVMALFPVLAERRRMQAGYLSGGEQQMLAIGRALMASPRLLLLDEPSLGLAPMIVEQIREIIRTVNDAGTSILLVEQNAAMALQIADHGYVLETGRIVKEAPGLELLGDPDIRRLYLGGIAGTDDAPPGARAPSVLSAAGSAREWMP